MKTTPHTTGLLLTTIASLLWGTVFISIEVGLHYANPYVLLFMRFLVSTIALLALSVPYNKTMGIIQELRKPVIWFLGSIYIAGFLLQYVGQNMTNASDATLLTNLAPILAPLAALLVLKDKMSRTQNVAIFLGLVGLLLIAGPKLSTSSGGALGDLFMFGTSVCYAFFIILSKRMNTGSLGSSFAMMIAMTVFMAPVALVEGFSPLSLNFGVIGWASILWMGLPCTLVAIALYLKGLSTISVSESSMLLLIQVLGGLALAAFLLGESLSYYEVVGAIAIFAAVTISSFSLSAIKAKLQRKDIISKEKIPTE